MIRSETTVTDRYCLATPLQRFVRQLLGPLSLSHACHCIKDRAVFPSAGLFVPALLCSWYARPACHPFQVDSLDSSLLATI